MSLYAEQFKKNDDVFRNTMEAIFQKYSSLSDPGIDVCLKTMTCRTGRGPVLIDSVEGERELEALKTRVKADYSIREFEDQEIDQMDLSGVTEDVLDGSGQKENSEIFWHGTESFQQSVNLNNTSVSLWSESSQPEKEDEELEKTLSSHGSTLLDVYPSMINQIGEAYRRQHVTDTAKAVVQKYRRKHWQAAPTQPNTSFKNRPSCALNKTTDISFSNQSPAQRSNGNCFKSSAGLPNLLKNNQNSSYESSACFYSPRRSSVDMSQETVQSPWTDLHLPRKLGQSPARVIDFSTLPYSGSPSCSDQSSDLDQTFDVEPTSHVFPVLSALASPRPSRADLKGMSVISQYSPNRVFSPNWKNTFRPSVLNMERQLNSTGSLKQRSVHHQVYSELLRSPHSSKQEVLSSPRRHVYDHIDQNSPNVGSPKRRSPVHHQVCSELLRSPHSSKQSVFSSPRRPVYDHIDQNSSKVESPKRRSPVHHKVYSELLRSPHGSKQAGFSSPRRPVYDHTDQNSSKVENLSHFTPSKRQRSFSGTQSTNSFSEPQIDAEFRKLYHHFICRGTSLCPSSHCHLCERHSKETLQSPGFSSSSMSALALTPLRTKLKKRRRQPEVEESLRFKRFRESRSPLKHIQLTDSYKSSPVSDLLEDKHTWDRGILLQCPSPGFLRGTGNLRRIREAKLRMQMNPRSLSWRDAPSGVHQVEAVSPMRLNQATVLLSPRRRLQYSLLQ